MKVTREIFYFKLSADSGRRRRCRCPPPACLSLSPFLLFFPCSPSLSVLFSSFRCARDFLHRDNSWKGGSHFARCGEVATDPDFDSRYVDNERERDFSWLAKESATVNDNDDGGATVEPVVFFFFSFGWMIYQIGIDRVGSQNRATRLQTDKTAGSIITSPPSSNPIAHCDRLIAL